jgi:hypothetical protein
MTTRPKTVWILGAGFPRSLNAPLLVDLFRQEKPIDVEAYFPEANYPGLARDVMAAQIAFNWGKSVEHLWEDAEQFLAFVDDAYSGAKEKRNRLNNVARDAYRIVPPKNAQLAPEGPVSQMMSHDLMRASRRALAAETSRFMLTNRDGELWFPYREWAAGLEPAIDSIVTFNYDLLLDELGIEGENFTIPLPLESPDPSKIPVFKLHGSVDWVASGSEWSQTKTEFEALTNPSGTPPAIAAPGRSKAPDGEPPFSDLWELAETAITSAQWVIFVGYRFPPTDALARVRLGRALAKENGHLVRRIDTVLGPKVDSEESLRLSTLLFAWRGERSLEETPIPSVVGGSNYLVVCRQRQWAEDFLTTYKDLARGQVWGP